MIQCMLTCVFMTSVPGRPRKCEKRHFFDRIPLVKGSSKRHFPSCVNMRSKNCVHCAFCSQDSANFTTIHATYGRAFSLSPVNEDGFSAFMKVL